MRRKASQEEIDEYFQNIQVMTNWGAKRAYNITKVRMDLNPRDCKFEESGQSISISQYFKDKYQISLDPN